MAIGYSFMRGEPLVAKMAVVAKYGVLPAAMIAALFYSPPSYSVPFARKYYQKPSN